MPDAEEQAAVRADEHIRAAAACLGQASLPDPSTSTVTACDDPTDGGPPGRVFVTRRYHLRGPASPGFFETVAAYWEGQGYRLIEDNRGGTYPYVWAEHLADGYRVGLDTTTTGELVIGASSPCFWPSASPREAYRSQS